MGRILSESLILISATGHLYPSLLVTLLGAMDAAGLQSRQKNYGIRNSLSTFTKRPKAGISLMYIVSLLGTFLWEAVSLPETHG